MSTLEISHAPLAPFPHPARPLLDVAALVTPRLLQAAGGPRRLAEALADRGVGSLVVRDATGVGAALDCRAYAADLREAGPALGVRTVRGPADDADAVAADVVVLDDARPASLIEARERLSSAARAAGRRRPVRAWATVSAADADAVALPALRTALVAGAAQAAGGGALLVLESIADLDGLDVDVLAGRR